MPLVQNQLPPRKLVRDPIYHQLNALLRELLGGGTFKAGDQFLTERQISERFGVSRVTANKALSHLVVGGAVEFRKGVGTFVREAALSNDLRSLVSFTQKARLLDKTPSTRVLSFSRVPAREAGPAVAKALNAAETAILVYCERLRFADEEPVILERRFLLDSRCPGLSEKMLAGSLYELLRERFGLELSGATQSVRAVNLSGEDALLLKTRPRSAALWVHATGFADGEPLWVEDTLYRGDRYEFQNFLDANQPPRSASASLMESPPLFFRK
jgi:GntR family transcriptional regulator